VQLSCAVISCGCMETDEEEILAGHFFMQFIATVMNSYFHTDVTNLNEFALGAKEAPRCSKQAQPQLLHRCRTTPTKETASDEAQLKSRCVVLLEAAAQRLFTI